MWRTAPVLLRPHVPLAPRTTLGLGGTARWYGHAQTRAALLSALHWADRHAVPVAVLGGGSNVVVADDGFDGLVLAVGTRGRALSWVSAPPAVLDLASLADSAADLAALQRRRWAQLQLEAGESWDAVVRWSVQLGLGALAPLSGIPGLVGAAPVQNIGAYGRELAHVACALDVYDRSLARLERWPAQRAAFAYRHSLFKTEPGRWLVLGLTVALPQGAALPLRYAELQRHLGARQPEPYTPAQVRAAVLTLRRRKSMCLDPGCPNHRSVGSFFTNPVISGAAFQVLTAHLAAASGASCELPHWPQPDGRIKLAAAWLIEAVGFQKGQRAGAVGLSSRHALALVAHEGATSTALLAFADRIQVAVQQRFGVTLEREPQLLGDAASVWRPSAP